MAGGILHRAGVAIVLVAVLLMPYGVCRGLQHVKNHDCCARLAQSATIKANCCTVRSELPAMVGEQVAPAPVAAFPIAASLLVAEPSFHIEFGAAETITGHSFPPGAAILRI